LTLAANAFSVNFAGNGAANTVARSDHNHGGQSWSGALGPFGLKVENTSGGGDGIQGFSATDDGVYGQTNSAGSTDSGVTGVSTNLAPGVRAFSSGGPGVYASSNNGPGVYASSGAGKAGDFVGDVRVSGQFTKRYTNGTESGALPVGYGYVSQPGNIQAIASTPNVTANKVGVGIYDITFAGLSYTTTSFATVVTVVDANIPQIATITSIAGKLRVRIYSLAGALVDSDFQFVTFNP
jgi:hypothetical protein